MKRPDQHIIETKSQRIFERLVPVEWVAREVKPDYGVDYLVEVFKNGESTGKTFFVCEAGKQIHDTIEDSIASNESKSITVKSIGTNKDGEVIAEFLFTWSFKVKAI